MRYIRTKDNKIFDLEKIKKNLKKDSAYPHLYDWKLEPTNDRRGSLRLSWMADFKGSKSKPEKLKTPRECAVILDCDSSEYKQANTIEELIDEWVYVKNHKEKPVLVYWLSTNKKHKDDDVYGAIWTDKGLIYVAKMNKKGELELL